MSASSKPTSSWVVVYAGQICIGHAISRGKTGNEASTVTTNRLACFRA